MGGGEGGEGGVTLVLVVCVPLTCVVLIKDLIMEKAMEDLKEETEQKLQEKKRYLDERVPPLDLEGLDKGWHGN